MQWFLYLIGAAWIAFGCCAILYTDDVRALLRKYLETGPPLVPAAVAAVIGLLLLLSGSASNHAWFIRLLGLLGIGKGVFIYMNPGDKWTRLSKYYQSAPDQTQRLFGIIAIIFGTALFSWIH